MRTGYGLGVFLVVAGLAGSAQAETVELVTYYPAPRQDTNIDRLHANSATVGDDFYSLTVPAALASGTLLVGRAIGVGPGFGGVPPTEALEVQGNVLANGPANSDALFKADRPANNQLSGLRLSTSGPPQWTVGSRNGTEHFHIFSDVDNATRLFIEQVTGNIGIGTETPNSRLDVRGSMSLGVTVATASMTLTEAHNVVLTNAAGNITITLPVATNRSGRTYIIKKTDADDDTVTINAAGGALIDGAASVVLYVQGDAVRVVTDGFNWFVISDEIRPHTAKMRRDVPQSMPGNGVPTKINLDAEEFDVGNIADAAGGRFTIRRAGKYQVTTYCYLSMGVSNNRMDLSISKNGADIMRSVELYGVAGTDPASTLTEVLDLVPGDTIEMVLRQFSSSNRDTSGIPTRPRMTVTEIRY